jgi:hypothetical protein
MFPIIAIGGAISAATSLIKGASWLSDHLGPSSTAAASGGKAAVKSQPQAMASPFEAALAAQSAGQSMPGSGMGGAATGSAATGGVMSAATVPPIHGTDYRMQAGIAAYDHIGEHHGNRAAPARPEGTDDDKSSAHDNRRHEPPALRAAAITYKCTV